VCWRSVPRARCLCRCASRAAVQTLRGHFTGCGKCGGDRWAQAQASKPQPRARRARPANLPPLPPSCACTRRGSVAPPRAPRAHAAVAPARSIRATARRATAAATPSLCEPGPRLGVQQFRGTLAGRCGVQRGDLDTCHPPARLHPGSCGETCCVSGDCDPKTSQCCPRGGVVTTLWGGCCPKERMCAPAGGAPFCCPAGSQCYNGACRDQRTFAWLASCARDQLVRAGAGRGAGGKG
jgi:hypothetical protein